MKKAILLLIVLMTLTALQCKKNTQEDQLPPITTSGTNTFGCLVNGNVWLPVNKGIINYGPPEYKLEVSQYWQNHSVTSVIISATQYESNATNGFYIALDKLDTGTYHLIGGLNYSDVNYIYYPWDSSGVVHIMRFDTIQKIISGTFSFTGYSDANITTAKSVSITDGRFDVHYPLAIH